MSEFSRRSFLATSAAAAVQPTRAVPAPSNVDIVVVGAGAAGIAAGRLIVAAGRRLAVFEASDRVGGRCFTDVHTFGAPYDRGARWLYGQEMNPVAKLGLNTGLNVYAAPPSQRLRIAQRDARDGEMEDFFATLVRCNRAIQDAARGKVDVPSAEALPRDLGDWRPAVEFVLGPFQCGRTLNEVSATDLAKSEPRGNSAFCREGVGTLLTKLAAGLPIQLSTPVRSVDWGGRRAEVQTAKGNLRARAVIITASTGVLGAGKIRFDPDLPRAYAEAIEKLGLGTYDHIALEFAGDPLGLESDDLVFEKASSQRTAALLANLSGSKLCYVDVAGELGANLSQEGQAAMVAFALDWLTDLYGSNVKQAVKRTHATRWNKDPWALGAFSAASPGGQRARQTLSGPLRERVWFAGEATHETQWGTVGGAWEAGERAAHAALKKVAQE